MSNTTRFNEADAGEVHRLLGEYLLQVLRRKPCEACGQSPHIDHRELTVIRQFLSDNHIDVKPGQGQLRSITDELPFKDPEFGLTQNG